MRLRFVVVALALFIHGSALCALLGASGDRISATSNSKVSCADNKPFAKPLPSPGPACEQEVFARRGRPFMFPARNGIAFGVSSEPDKPSSLNLWVDNQTDKAESLYFCCASTLFDHIDIFDSRGHRVMSKTDQIEQKARAEGRTIIDACTCSGWSAIPPHTIQIFVSADISQGYALQPDRYTISERSPRPPYNLHPDENEGAPKVPLGLAISIP
jgi:hypothetical protein